METNFKQLYVEAAFDQWTEIDARRAVANAIHQNTSDIALDETARAIYRADGPVGIPDGQLDDIRRILASSSLLVCVKRAALAALDGKTPARPVQEAPETQTPETGQAS